MALGSGCRPRHFQQLTALPDSKRASANAGPASTRGQADGGPSLRCHHTSVRAGGLRTQSVTGRPDTLVQKNYISQTLSNLKITVS